MKALLVVAAAYGLLVLALRARRPVPTRGGATGPRRSVEARVRAFVDRVNLVVIVGLTLTAIYVVVTRVLWEL